MSERIYLESREAPGYRRPMISMRNLAAQRRAGRLDFNQLSAGSQPLRWPFMTKPGHPPASIQPKARRRIGFAAPVRAVVQRVLLLAVGMVIIAASILAGIGGRSTSPLMPGSSGYRGLELWRSHGCGTCHALFGLGGHIGPDLTNVMRRRNDAYVRAVVRHGVGAMPNYELDENDTDDLIAYLWYLDALGTYPLDSPAAPWFGIAR